MFCAQVYDSEGRGHLSLSDVSCLLLGLCHKPLPQTAMERDHFSFGISLFYRVIHKKCGTLLLSISSPIIDHSVDNLQ